MNLNTQSIFILAIYIFMYISMHVSFDKNLSGGALVAWGFLKISGLEKKIVSTFGVHPNGQTHVLVFVKRDIQSYLF